MKLSIALLVVLGLVAEVALSQRVVRKRQRKPLQASQQQPKLGCEESDVEFELITGFVYSNADDIIESNIGALQMAECLQQCRANVQCRALNFETGLCVLFKSQSGENSDSLSASQFPVFTLYAQKVCVPQRGRSECRSPWAYETVPEVTINENMVTERAKADSRNDCANICLNHERFTCRSAAFDSASKQCLMSTLDREMAGRLRNLVSINSTLDYMEVACGSKPDRMCEFQKIPGKIMKTVDAVYLDTESLEECRDRCLKADFECYSYDFGSASEPICRLSHHSTTTLAHIRNPYLEIENATTYELQACYKVAIECKASEMIAQISTSTVFNGKVYARTRPNSCVEDITNKTEFSITLPYNSVDCDVQRYNVSNFQASLVIQHHDMIVTQADVGLALHCKYELKNTVVTNSLINGDAGVRVDESLATEYIREVVVDSPEVTMKVSDPSGVDVVSAEVGDDLALRFEIRDADSPYEIFVREVVALDGRDSSEIVLIDEDGCPTDQNIMGFVFQVNNNGKVLHAPFQAFKFPSTEVVQFRALVTPCHPKCEPTNCNTRSFDGSVRPTPSYGKRRRRREVNENEIMVAQSIQIKDKFLFSDGEVDIAKITAEGDCSNTYTGLIIAAILFIVAQVAILTTWSYQWHKKRANKEITPHFPLPHPAYRGRSSTTSSHASTSTYVN